MPGDFEIMGHQDEAKTVAALQLLQEVDDVGLAVLVEVARRLIGEQQRGSVDQSAGNRHAPLLTAGQRVGISIATIGEAYPSQQGV